MNLGDGSRVLVFAWAHPSSHTPKAWGAGPDRPGVHLLEELTTESIADIKRRIEAARGPGDLVVASIHWGGNWGYEIGLRQRWFAHRLIDRAGVNVVYGHSSHQPMAVEIYRGRPVLYGCGDFINDYRHDEWRAQYRSDLAAMYFLRLDTSTGLLQGMTLVPMRLERRCLRRASRADALWLCNTLNQGGFAVDFKTRVARWKRLKRTRFGHPWCVGDDGTLTIQLRQRLTQELHQAVQL